MELSCLREEGRLGGKQLASCTASLKREGGKDEELLMTLIEVLDSSALRRMLDDA